MERTIWKSYGMLDLNEIEEFKEIARENLECNEVENITDDKVQEEVYYLIDMYYDDERLNLNKRLNGRVIAIADLGLWYGRKQGYKVLSNNLNEVLGSISCDEVEILFDQYNVKAVGYHHDGSNYVLYRELREDRNIDNFLDKIYSGEEISSSTLNYYTRSLRPYIKDIYGI